VLGRLCHHYLRGTGQDRETYAERTSKEIWRGKEEALIIFCKNGSRQKKGENGKGQTVTFSVSAAKVKGSEGKRLKGGRAVQSGSIRWGTSVIGLCLASHRTGGRRGAEGLKGEWGGKRRQNCKVQAKVSDCGQRGSGLDRGGEGKKISSAR